MRYEQMEDIQFVVFEARLAFPIYLILRSISTVSRQRQWNIIRRLHKGEFLAHLHHLGVKNETYT